MKFGSAYRALAVAVVGVALLSACTDRSDRVYFDGNYYPARSDGVRDDRRNFTASVKRADQGAEGAQMAALHEARRYCVNYFGTSDIDWASGPEGRAGPAFARSGDRVSVSGRCVIWR